MTKSVLLVGVGGQGTILAGKVLCAGLLASGYDVKMSEIHGMSQRGGAVSTHVRYSKSGVYSPVIEKGGADIIVAFEKLEAARWLTYLKPGGMVLVNDKTILPSVVLSGAMEYPENVLEELVAQVNTKTIDAYKMATELGNARGENLLMLGAAAKMLGLDDINWDETIKASVKPQFVEANQKVFKAGFEQ